MSFSSSFVQIIMSSAKYECKASNKSAEISQPTKMPLIRIVNQLSTVKCVLMITKQSNRLQDDLNNEFKSRGAEYSEKIFHLMMRAKKGFYRNSKPEFGVPESLLVSDLKDAGLESMAAKAQKGYYDDLPVNNI